MILGVPLKFPLNVSATANGTIYFNVDTVVTPGMYWLTQSANNPYGAGYEGILFVLNYNEEPCVFQIALRGADDRGVIKYRWRNGSGASWTSWKTISTTTT